MPHTGLGNGDLDAFLIDLIGCATKRDLAIPTTGASRLFRNQTVSGLTIGLMALPSKQPSPAGLDVFAPPGRKPRDLS